MAGFGSDTGAPPSAVPEGAANVGFIAAIVAVATIGGLLFGYDSGAVNGTQPGLKAAFALDEAGLGFTVGSLLIGCFIGAFFAGTLADRAGRRNVMRLAAVLFLGGALVQGLTADHTVFVIARIVGGMAVGAASVLSPASSCRPLATRKRGLSGMKNSATRNTAAGTACIRYIHRQAA